MLLPQPPADAPHERTRAGRRILTGWCFVLVAASAALAGFASAFHPAREGLNSAGYVVFACPYAAAVLLTWLVVRRSAWAAGVAAAGVLVKAGLAWWDVTHQLTEGYEYEWDNAMRFCCCCGSNYLILGAVAPAAWLLARAPVAPPHGPEGGQGSGQVP
jgi:hypothetical protein